MKPQDDTKFVPGNKNDIGGRKEKTPIDADGIKIAAGAVAGVAIGGGAAYAASEFLGGDAVEAEAKTAEVPKVDSEAKQTKATNAEEAKVDANAKEHIEQHRISPQEQFYKDNEVKINTIETTTDASGQVRHVASGTVDGHQAVFVDDGQGNAQVAIVDHNDNGQIDEDEIHDISDAGVTMNGLASQLSDTPAEDVVAAQPVANSEPTVQVIAVENNVEVDGQTVDVAKVTINEEPVVFVDTDQNGEVNVAISDVNHDGQIQDNEVADVSNSHIPMPTVDDTEQAHQVVDNEIPDYSNDADINTYEV